MKDFIIDVSDNTLTKDFWVQFKDKCIDSQTIISDDLKLIGWLDIQHYLVESTIFYMAQNN